MNHYVYGFHGRLIFHKEPFFYGDDKQDWLLKIAWGLQTMNMSLMEAKEMVSFGRKSDFWVGDGDFQDIHGVRYEDDFVITPLVGNLGSYSLGLSVKMVKDTQVTEPKPFCYQNEVLDMMFPFFQDTLVLNCNMTALVCFKVCSLASAQTSTSNSIATTSANNSGQLRDSIPPQVDATLYSVAFGIEDVAEAAFAYYDILLYVLD
ncbi:hypothetical protein Tco_0952911 [Tanacetum coccineum]|uniref:Uncharacterized protein n=1 Tax=Tanacetum coccineum TaxID=301880 RepID=A0ABQ5DYB3_9ASTR